ncbi:lysylphosphatidylglycerol synthase transmembrane domain-containing protein [Salinibacter altiplanensis]|uniref:lysylphosphatidylglycerol synthase transmembrane domain-containing protein n=1 Tax=Salinibacter altiplanensis TaxID=1803181 RepID=UPI000C9EE603|nr:lysylphosphatidylglycerol synthase transmembrane domain-containing protein [Salinibacter altiplanensis]
MPSPPSATSPPSTDDDPAQEPTRPRTAGSARNIVASLLLSALVLAGVGYVTFDAEAFRRLIQHLRPGLLVAAGVVAFARLGLGGWRLSQVSEGRLSVWSGTRGQLAWDFFSSVTPSVVGGGPVAAFYVARDEDMAIGDSAALMFFCVLLDQLWFLVAIPLLVLATVTIDLLPDVAGAIGGWSLLAYFGGLLVWAGLYAYATLVRPRLLVEVTDWCFRWRYLRRFRGTVMPELRSYFRRARHLRSRSLAFYASGFVLTALAWIARYALVFFIVRSVHAADALLLFARAAAMMLVGLVMPTPGGSGGLEGLYALFIGPLMPDALVAPTLLTWRLLGYYLFIALGAYLFLHQLQRLRTAESTTRH